MYECLLDITVLTIGATKITLDYLWIHQHTYIF